MKIYTGKMGLSIPSVVIDGEYREIDIVVDGVDGLYYHLEVISVIIRCSQ